MRLLDLVAALRLRLDDAGGDTGTPPSGYTHWWEYSDKGCIWGNNELVGFLNDAEDEYCRRVPIVDSEEFSIPLVAGTAIYNLDPVILSVQRVHSTTRDLDVCKTFFLDASRNNIFPPASFYLENLQNHQLKILSTPTQAETLQLTVQRLPLVPLSWAQRTTQSPEIHAQFHSALVFYAAHLAYLKRDTDTFSAAEGEVSQSGMMLKLFERAVGPARSAADLDWTRKLANRRPKAVAHFI